MEYGSPIWATIRCVTCHARNGWCSCATQTCVTISRRCARRNDVVSTHLPVQLTSFVGRGSQIGDVAKVLDENRFVTLTGAGGGGRDALGDTDRRRSGGRVRRRGLVRRPCSGHQSPCRACRPGARSGPCRPAGPLDHGDGVEIRAKPKDVVAPRDNCEHLLDASAALVIALLDAGPEVTILATSREPIGIGGELTWRVPSLSLDGEAVELFVDRARLATPNFDLTQDNSYAVTEICRRLDGMPLAIELAAARTRTLSLTQIVDSLHHNFRLLAGGARTSVRRQQTLRASIDWSHAADSPHPRLRQARPDLPRPACPGSRPQLAVPSRRESASTRRARAFASARAMGRPPGIRG